jgi:acyl carrier protein
MDQDLREIGPIVEAVRTFLLENFLPGDPAESLRDDDLLLEGGIVDSGSVIAVASFLEERFRITVADDDLVVEHFATVRHIARYVATRLAGTCVSS